MSCLRITAWAPTLGKMHASTASPGLALNQAPALSGAPNLPRRPSLRTSRDSVRERQTFEWIKIKRNPSGAGELGPGGVRCSLKAICLSPSLSLLTPSRLPCWQILIPTDQRSGTRAAFLPRVWGLRWQLAEGRGVLLLKLERMGETGGLETHSV